MKRKFLSIVGLLGFLSANSHAFNMAYVEVNSNRFDNVACYVYTDTKKPFFQIASILAANINGENPNKPEIFMNPQVVATLDSGQVKKLHAAGIKVLLTLLGNHQNAGWACMTDARAARRLADDVVRLVRQYDLDGIDIDDEYSLCASNNYSMIMLAKAIKEHPGFNGKLLSKALYADDIYFRAQYEGHTLSEYLDYGWEMTYGMNDFMGRLRSYVQAGMPISHLMVGGWTRMNYPQPYEYGKFAATNNVAGMMVYDVTEKSLVYLSSMQQGANHFTGVEELPQCLRR